MLLAKPKLLEPHKILPSAFSPLDEESRLFDEKAAEIRRIKSLCTIFRQLRNPLFWLFLYLPDGARLQPQYVFFFVWVKSVMFWTVLDKVVGTW